MSNSKEGFRPRDLIESYGTGANGEKLVATLADHYPDQLKATLIYRENDELAAKIDADALVTIAKIAGVDEVDSATVRGGHRDERQAWVSFVWIDPVGNVEKGVFPYSDLAKGKSDDLLTQRDSLLASPAARDAAFAAAKAVPEVVADPVVEAELEETKNLNAQLQEKLEAAEAAAKAVPKAPEPIQGYANQNVRELSPQIKDATLEQARAVIAYENAQDEPRDTLVKAAQKRIDDLDAKAAADVAELEALRAEKAARDAGETGEPKTGTTAS